MLQDVAAKIARNFQSRTQNPEIAQLGWPELLAIVIELLKILLPLLDEWCPMEPADVLSRASTIQPLIGKNWWARRAYPFMARWYYAQFHRRIEAGLQDLGDEIDADEIEAAMVAVCETLTEDEIRQVRAEVSV